MKKEFLGYVLAIVCAGIYMRAAADGRAKNTDSEKNLAQKLHMAFEREAKKGDLPSALLLLSIISEDAVQRGKKAPSYNLCDLGAICHDNKGISRINMPQLSGKPMPGSQADALPRDKDGDVDGKEYFGRYLVDSKKYTVTEEDVPVASLKATQNELEGAKVAGIYAALQDPKSQAYREIKNSYLYISSDNYVLDGHHRWAALLADAYRRGNIAGVTIKVKRIGAPISVLVEVANKWAADFGIQQKEGVASHQGSEAPAL